jgi:hypothetical protein
METIDLQGIKTLVAERIKEPEKYLDKPLIIWRADIRDGSHIKALYDVFSEYNEDKDKLAKRWFKIASVRDVPSHHYDMLVDMLKSRSVDKNDNRPYWPVHTMGFPEKCDRYTVGLLVIDPVRAEMYCSRNPSILNNYHSVINERKWGNIKLTEGVPVIAYMCCTEAWFETPEAYPNAEQYMFI